MSPQKSSLIILRSPLLAQPYARPAPDALSKLRVSVRPWAILDVVRRRGRSLGLLAQYEESRLISCR